MASTLTVDNIVGATSSSNIHIPGHMVQYVESSTTTQVTLTTGSLTDIMSTTITPKFQNSKFLVEWNCFVYYPGAAASWNALRTQLFRNSTGVYVDGYSLGSGAIYGAQAYMDYTNQSYLDTPNTTSPITYKIQMASYGANTIYLQYSAQRSVMSVTEIAQ